MTCEVCRGARPRLCPGCDHPAQLIFICDFTSLDELREALVPVTDWPNVESDMKEWRKWAEGVRE